MTFADVRTRPLIFALFVSTAALTLGITAGGQAQTSTAVPKDPRIGALIETLGKTKTPSSAAISPDGTTVAWAVRSKEGSQIHLSDVANPDAANEKTVGTGLGATACGSSAPKGSPKGRGLGVVLALQGK